jgi:hypothetical protein
MGPVREPLEGELLANRFFLDEYLCGSTDFLGDDLMNIGHRFFGPLKMITGDMNTFSSGKPYGFDRDLCVKLFNELLRLRRVRETFMAELPAHTIFGEKVPHPFLVGLDAGGLLCRGTRTDPLFRKGIDKACLERCLRANKSAINVFFLRVGDDIVNLCFFDKEVLYSKSLNPWIEVAHH